MSNPSLVLIKDLFILKGPLYLTIVSPPEWDASPLIILLPHFVLMLLLLELGLSAFRFYLDCSVTLHSVLHLLFSCVPFLCTLIICYLILQSVFDKAEQFKGTSWTFNFESIIKRARSNAMSFSYGKNLKHRKEHVSS